MGGGSNKEREIQIEIQEREIEKNLRTLDKTGEEKGSAKDTTRKKKAKNPRQDRRRGVRKKERNNLGGLITSSSTEGEGNES